MKRMLQSAAFGLSTLVSSFVMILPAISFKTCMKWIGYNFLPSFKTNFSTATLGRSAGTSLAMLLLCVNIASAQELKDADVALQERVQKTLKKNGETLRFMENKGQVANSDVLYYFENTKGAVYIETNRIRFVTFENTLVPKRQLGTNLETTTDRKSVV